MKTRTCILALALVLLGGAAQAGRFYWTIEAGASFPRATAFVDDDPTTKTPTPMYGVGYQAAGDYGTFGSFGGGLGVRLARVLRTDFRVDYLPRIQFDGQTNFLTPPAPEPTQGSGNALTLLGRVFIDTTEVVGHGLFGFAPYAGAGIGFSHNSWDPMVMYYPSLAVPHTFTTPGGARTDFAWTVSAGLTRKLGGGFHLDLEYRYQDLGEMGTDAGNGVMYRPATQYTKVVPIGGTHGALRLHGLAVGVRKDF